jgi:peptidoglycan/xylan/chitin deacetylase (PgdA/CDA1 family)
LEKLKRPEIVITCRFLVSLFIIILAIVNAPLSANPSKPVHADAKNALPSSSTHQQSKLSKNELAMQEVQTVAQKYMKALLDQQYSVMWSLLHPQIKAKWANEGAFATFIQNRFKEYTLQDFTLDNVQELPYWVDPETMAQYTNLEKLSASFQLVPRATSFQHSHLPPEDLHPGQLFQNLPIIIQFVGNQDDKGGNWFILDGGPADLEAPILPPMTPINKIVQVPILMYHHILPFSAANSSLEYSRIWLVPPESFSQQMDYLVTHGYHTITFNQLFDALYYGGPLPSKPIIITFDDGDADHYQYAYPILLAHHFSGMFYIITGKVGQAGRMTWSQLSEMLAHGMQMGSHTVHHLDLARLLRISEQEVQQELQQSQLTLETKLGIVIQQFCYPFGDPFYRGNWVQRHIIITMLAGDGYVGATTAFGMTGSIQDSLYPFALLRIPVYGGEPLQWFVASLPWA